MKNLSGFLSGKGKLAALKAPAFMPGRMNIHEEKTTRSVFLL